MGLNEKNKLKYTILWGSLIVGLFLCPILIYLQMRWILLSLSSHTDKKGVWLASMPDEPISRIILIIILILLGAFFGSSETAFTTADRIRLKVKAENNNRSAKLALWVTKNLDNTIVTILVLNALLQTLMSTLATLFFVDLLNSSDMGSLVSTLVVAAVIFILCDSIPKTIAHAIPERIAMINSYFASVLIVLLYPFTVIFYGLNLLLKKIFKFKEDTQITEEDFSNVIESIEEKGDLDTDASEIILSSLEFSDTIVRDVLTPRHNIVALDLDKLTTKSLNDFLLKSKYSRIPVYKDTIDNIVGVIVVREYIKAYVKNQKLSIKRILNKPYFVTPRSNLGEIIDGFRKNNTHIAFVRDEKNVLIGMVTMEDVLEELVGQIAEPLSRLKKADQ